MMELHLLDRTDTRGMALIHLTHPRTLTKTYIGKIHLYCATTVASVALLSQTEPEVQPTPQPSSQSCKYITTHLPMLDGWKDELA